MRFDFSVTDTPTPAMPLALRTIYQLNADPTYDVHKNWTGNGDYIALRTLGGRGSIRIEGMEELEVAPDTLILFKHDNVRRYRCMDETWDFWWYEFSCAGSPGLPLNIVLAVSDSETEVGYFQRSLDLLKENTPISRVAASAILGVLICEWRNQLSRASDHPSPHQAAVESLISYLRTESLSGVRVEQMAARLGLCERRFREVFKAVTGQSPKTYLNSIRMRMAEELLRNTPFSIGDISDRLGYSSQFHFCREFRKVRGIPPSQYRAQGR